MLAASAARNCCSTYSSPWHFLNCKKGPDSELSAPSQSSGPGKLGSPTWQCLSSLWLPLACLACALCQLPSQSQRMEPQALP